MGGKWGYFQHARGIVYYAISPFEQRVFAGFWKKQADIWSTRIRENFFYVVPPYALMFAVMIWAEAEYKRIHRKDPKQYEHDT
ncbi:cytochrome b-c1 complex subunit 8-like isoform X2 [Zophobas morio]|uniref:cytochrome b-c1 complex subunit 8-like isoform X2 n=1 Tax=Zophobas morio TaxID=2755281 RepID=UPI003083B9DE